MDKETAAFLVADIARDVLRDVAPAELPIFGPASKAYFHNPAVALKEAHAKDSVLGFGMDLLPVLLTPVVLHILSQVLEILEDIATKALTESLRQEIPQILKSMFRKFYSPATDKPPILTREQVALVRANVLTAAKKQRVPLQKAEALADSIVAKLVLQ